MAKKKPTSIILSQKALSIKNRLAPVFGLVNIITAGLELFDLLPDSEKIRRIHELATRKDGIVNSEIETAEFAASNWRGIIRIIKSLDDSTYAMSMKFLDSDEKKMYETLRKLSSLDTRKADKTIAS